MRLPGSDELAAREPVAPKPSVRETAMAADAVVIPHAPDLDRPEEWRRGVCETYDQPRALAQLERIGDTDILQQIAVHARLANVRLAAAKRIRDEASLRAIVALTAEKDKRVHRHCADALNRLAQMRKRAQQIAGWEQRLQNLLEEQPVNSGKLYALRQKLSTVDEGDDLADCRRLLVAAGDRELAEKNQLREMQTVLELAKGLVTDCDRLAVEAGQIEQVRTGLRMLRERWAQAPAWVREHTVGLTAGRTLAAAEEALNTAGTDATRVAECRRFLAAQVTAPITKIVRNAWLAMPKPAHPHARQQLEYEWEQLLVQNTKRRGQQNTKATSAANHDVAQARELIEAFERALDNGELRTAALAQRQLETVTIPAHLKPRLRVAIDKLRQLRDWSRWSAGRAREELLTAAAQLQDGTATIDEVAEAVPRLREAWKRLEQRHRIPDEQQQKFDALLAQVFEPVLAYRAEQGAMRADALTRNLSAMETWESWFQSIDWGQVNITEVQKRWQAIIVERRNLPRPFGKDLRLLKQRFDKLAKAIQERIDPLVAEQTDYRTQLITKARFLLNSADTREAVAQMRALQGQWRDSSHRVVLPRKVHDQLWNAFRETADAVYEKRKLERERDEAERRSQHDRHQMLLNALETAVLQAMTPAAVDAAVATFEAAWNGDGEAETGSVRHDMSAARKLLQQAESRKAKLRGEKQRSELSSLMAKAGLVAKVESAVAAGGNQGDTLAEVEAAWKALPPLPGEAERLLKQRLHNAVHTTGQDLAQGHAERAAKLLELEIRLDLPSPDDCADSRRQRQLALLKAGHRLLTREEVESEILRWYAKPALDDAGQTARMAAILAKAMAVGTQAGRT